MAVTAKFVADFQDFNTGVEQASQKLETFGGTVERTTSTSDQLRSSLGRFDSIFGELGHRITPAIHAIDELADSAGKSFDQIGAISTAGLALGAGVAGWQLGRAAAEFFGLDKAISETTASLFKWGNASAEVAAAKQDVINRAIERGAAATISYTDALKYNDEWSKKTLDDWKDFEKGLKAITVAGDDWRKTLDTIDGETVEAVKAFRDEGVSQKDLAAAYSLTEVQMRAIEKARQADKDATREQEKAHRAAAEAAKQYDEIVAHMAKETFALAQEHEKQWREAQFQATQRQNAAILAELDAHVKLNAAYGLTADGSIKMTGAAEDLRQALDALHETRVEGFSQEQQELLLTKQYTDALLAEAQAQDAENAALAEMPDEVENANVSVSRFVGTLTTGIKDLADFNRALSDFNDQFANNNLGTPEVAGFNIPVIAPLGGRRVIQARAGGGDVASGEPYMVGERGPELFVPKTSGSIVPSGAVTVQNTFYVNGTAQDAANQIMDLITKSMKQARQFPAS